MWHVLLCDLALAASAEPARGHPASPSTTAAEPAPFLQEVAERVDVYGRLDGNLAFDQNGVDLANNGSRFGITARQELTHGYEVFGRGEWAVKLGESDTIYNVTLNPNTNLGVAETSTDQSFETRLGFVGIRLSDYGSISLGKQWGVYYDVTEWTDAFTVFGANGSSTYNAGTDGGQTGEGRANDAVQYRVALGPVRLGAQAQFLDARSPEVDSLSGSVVVDAGSGILAGAAYSRAFLDFGTEIVGYEGGDAQAFTVGVRFEQSGFTLASVNTWTRNHELVTTDRATVMYDTLGSELYVARRFGDVVMPYGGFDFAIPRNLDARFVAPSYGTRDVILGTRLDFDARGGSFAYVEGRTGRSHDAYGNRAADAILVGLRLEYSLRRGLGLEP